MIIEIKDVLNNLANNVINSLKENMGGYGLGDSNLANSLRAEVDNFGIKIYASDYWQYAQAGRGAGKVPYKFEDILMDWIKRYDIHSVDGDDRKFAQNIKWHTIKYGSRIYRNPSLKRDFIKDAVDKNIKAATDDITKSLIKEIKSEIKKK